MSEWVKTLKPGDKVAIRSGYGHASYSITTVERTTATQVIVASGSRFNKGSLRRIGDVSSYSNAKLEPVTQDIRDKVETAKLTAWLESLTRTRPSLETLRAMKAAADGIGASSGDTPEGGA